MTFIFPYLANISPPPPPLFFFFFFLSGALGKIAAFFTLLKARRMMRQNNSSVLTRDTLPRSTRGGDYRCGTLLLAGFLGTKKVTLHSPLLQLKNVSPSFFRRNLSPGNTWVASWRCYHQQYMCGFPSIPVPIPRASGNSLCNLAIPRHQRRLPR